MHITLIAARSEERRQLRCARGAVMTPPLPAGDNADKRTSYCLVAVPSVPTPACVRRRRQISLHQTIRAR
jgi:hypothetical protein